MRWFAPNFVTSCDSLIQYPSITNSSATNQPSLLHLSRRNTMTTMSDITPKTSKLISDADNPCPQFDSKNLKDNNSPSAGIISIVALKKSSRIQKQKLKAAAAALKLPAPQLPHATLQTEEESQFSESVEYNKQPYQTERIATTTMMVDCIRGNEMHATKSKSHNLNSKKVRFTSDDDLMMVRLVAKYGKKWNLISQKMNASNETRIRNRYYSYIRKNPDSLLARIHAETSAQAQAQQARAVTTTKSLTTTARHQQQSLQQSDSSIESAAVILCNEAECSRSEQNCLQRRENQLGVESSISGGTIECEFEQYSAHQEFGDVHQNDQRFISNDTYLAYFNHYPLCNNLSSSSSSNNNNKNNNLINHDFETTKSVYFVAPTQNPIGSLSYLQTASEAAGTTAMINSTSMNFNSTSDLQAKDTYQQNRWVSPNQIKFSEKATSSFDFEVTAAANEQGRCNIAMHQAEYERETNSNYQQRSTANNEEIMLLQKIQQDENIKIDVKLYRQQQQQEDSQGQQHLKQSFSQRRQAYKDCHLKFNPNLFITKEDEKTHSFLDEPSPLQLFRAAQKNQFLDEFSSYQFNNYNKNGGCNEDSMVDNVENENEIRVAVDHSNTNEFGTRMQSNYLLQEQEMNVQQQQRYECRLDQIEKIQFLNSQIESISFMIEQCKQEILKEIQFRSQQNSHKLHEISSQQ